MDLKINIGTQALKEISKNIDEFVKDFNKSLKAERSIKMNFLEAVQALKDGLCEGICPKDASYVLILDKLSGGLKYKHTNRPPSLVPNTYLGDWKLVNPIKQYREEEVVVYGLLDKNNIIIDIYLNKPCSPCIKLTGVRRVEVKPKIKRRKEIKGVKYIECDQCLKFLNPDAKLFAEWYEDVDHSGKVEHE